MEYNKRNYKKMIGIVYHCFLVNNWKEIVTRQLARVKNSGLYDTADLFYTTVVCAKEQEDEFKLLLEEYNKIQPIFTSENKYEYEGIKKVKELGDTYDDIKILYFHTKGVSNQYVTYNGKEHSSEKYNNIKAWAECLEYFLIDKWNESVQKLNEFDNVGVTCDRGWYWGNFWWTQSSQVKQCGEVTFSGSRWDYEGWLNGFNKAKCFEWYKFSFNPYVTEIPKEWYKNPDKFKGAKIIIHNARYGASPFEIDEGYSGLPLNIFIDVTDKIKQKVEKNNNEYIEVHVDNNLTDNDPTFGFRKFLFINFSLDNEPEKIYNIGCHEGMTLYLKF